MSVWRRRAQLQFVFLNSVPKGDSCSHSIKQGLLEPASIIHFVLASFVPYAFFHAVSERLAETAIGKPSAWGVFQKDVAGFFFDSDACCTMGCACGRPGPFSPGVSFPRVLISLMPPNAFPPFHALPQKQQAPPCPGHSKEQPRRKCALAPMLCCGPKHRPPTVTLPTLQPLLQKTKKLSRAQDTGPNPCPRYAPAPFL